MADLLKVELSHEDISEIAEAIHKVTKESQGYLEFQICLWIREKKQVDFFEEEVLKIYEEFDLYFHGVPSSAQSQVNNMAKKIINLRKAYNDLQRKKKIIH